MTQSNKIFSFEMFWLPALEQLPYLDTLCYKKIVENDTLKNGSFPSDKCTNTA